MLQKCENYHNAVTQLADAVTLYQRSPEDSLYRDGLIQRFEFTFELAWKSLKEYMEDQGLNLPAPAFSKQVFKAAYAAEIISDEAAWLSMLDARNITSHVYDENTAISIARRICEDFLPPLQTLAHFYQRQ